MSTRGKYNYGFTVVAAPPVVAVDRLEREVNGTMLVYLRRAGRVRVFDGTKELRISKETEEEILRARPQGEQQPDPLGWWN